MSLKFLHLEDTKGTPMLESLMIDGEITSDVGDILAELHTFYKDLYGCHDSKMDIEIEHFLNSLTCIPEVIGDTSNMIGEIMHSEVEKAIKSLRLGKSPGSDGLIADFYKHYSDHLVLILTLVFN